MVLSVFSLVLLWFTPALYSLSFYIGTGGIVLAFAAVLVGLIDWIEIPAGTHAKRVGLWHGLGNSAVLVLFIAGWLTRSETALVTPSLALSGAAVLLMALLTRFGAGVVSALVRRPAPTRLQEVS